MGVLSSIFMSSVRNHWVALSLWIPGQVLFGTLLANKGKLEVLGTKILDVSDSLTSHEIFEYHKLSGTILLAFAAWLIFLKLWLILGSVPRPSIKNVLVEGSIRNHFVFVTLLFLTQYFTHGDGGKLTLQYTGLPKETLGKVHAINAYIILFQVIVLTIEKFYLLSSRPSTTEKKAPKIKKIN